jgi:hypothetical protein
MKTKRFISHGAALGITAAGLMGLSALAGGPSADQGTLYGSRYMEETQGTGLHLRDVPPAVRMAFRSQVGDAPIRRIVEQTRPEVAANEPVYKIELEQGIGPAFPTLWISANGNIIKEENMNANLSPYGQR